MIRFRLHGVPLCFTGVHMAAHTKNLDRRNEVQWQEESLRQWYQKDVLAQEYHQILKTKFSDPRCETLLDHECVQQKERYRFFLLEFLLVSRFIFWSGDLNYRLDESVSQERAIAAVHSNETDSLKPFDQVIIAIVLTLIDCFSSWDRNSQRVQRSPSFSRGQSRFHRRIATTLEPRTLTPGSFILHVQNKRLEYDFSSREKNCAALKREFRRGATEFYGDLGANWKLAYSKTRTRHINNTATAITNR